MIGSTNRKEDDKLVSRRLQSTENALRKSTKPTLLQRGISGAKSALERRKTQPGTINSFVTGRTGNDVKALNAKRRGRATKSFLRPAPGVTNPLQSLIPDTPNVPITGQTVQPFEIPTDSPMSEGGYSAPKGVDTGSNYSVPQPVGGRGTVPFTPNTLRGPEPEPTEVPNNTGQAMSAAQIATDKFNAPIPMGGPLRRNKFTTRSNFGPAIAEQGIKAPKTMGDMLRYNREVAAEKQTADIADAEAKTGIAAFAANRQAEHLGRSDANDALSTKQTGTHYNRSDDAMDTRNALYAKVQKDNSSLALRNQGSLESGRAAQAESMTQNALTSQVNRERGEAPARLASAASEATIAYASDPTSVAAQDKLRALTQIPATPATQLQLAKLAQDERKGFVDYLKANPQMDLDINVALEEYMNIGRTLGGY